MCNSRKLKNSIVQAKILFLFFSSLKIRNISWDTKQMISSRISPSIIGLKDIREKKIFLYPNNFYFTFRTIYGYFHWIVHPKSLATWSQAKIQQTKMLVTCQRFGDLFLFGLVWQYSSVQTKYNKGRFKVMATYLQQ